MGAALFSLNPNAQIDILVALNTAFNPTNIGGIVQQQAANKVFQVGVDLAASYQTLGIYPANAGEALLWGNYLGSLKSKPSNQGQAHAHDDIVITRQTNLEGLTPTPQGNKTLPMYTKTHMDSSDQHVQVTTATLSLGNKGDPQPYLVISSPILPNAPLRSSARRRATRKTRP